eukprot:scaffold164689_cov45-Prasinocladus_malaysianus.AAC.1
MNALTALNLIPKKTLSSTVTGRKTSSWSIKRPILFLKAVEQLLELEETRGEGVCTQDTIAVGVSRLGAPDQQIVAGTMKGKIED